MRDYALCSWRSCLSWTKVLTIRFVTPTPPLTKHASWHLINKKNLLRQQRSQMQIASDYMFFICGIFPTISGLESLPGLMKKRNVCKRKIIGILLRLFGWLTVNLAQRQIRGTVLVERLTELYALAEIITDIGNRPGYLYQP